MERSLASIKGKRILIYLALTSGLLNSCSTIKVPEYARHIIMGNKEGNLLDPAKGIKRKIPHGEVDPYIKRVLTSIDNHKVVEEKGIKKKKILIFVHGGLNSRRASLHRAEELTEEMGEDHYYPVFINWISGPINTYGEHVSLVRQGQVHRFWGPLTSPFYFLADLGRGIVRAPVVVGRQIASDSKAIARRYRKLQRTNNKTQELFLELNNKYYCAQQERAGQTIKISQGEVKRSLLNQTGRAFLYVVTFVPKLLSSALLIDPLGTSSWKNMRRRTKALFQTTVVDKSTPIKSRLDDPRPGAVALFMDQLAKRSCQHEQTGCQYEIILIGHSMGTIVLDELIRIYGCRKGKKAGHDQEGAGETCLNFSNIVYLAAASSIRGFQEKVIPHLQANSDAQFYNLMLHELAEVRELHREFLDLPPRGSLLVWIDNFLSTPETPLDRTLGRWENVLQAIHVIPEKVRSQITLKAFGVGRLSSKRFPEGNPRRHGDFAKKGMEFWRPRFWEAHAPVEPRGIESPTGFCDRMNLGTPVQASANKW